MTGINEIVGSLEPCEIPQDIDLWTDESDQKYPHGYYGCGCGKFFHGHRARDAHSFNCTNRLGGME